MAAKMEWARIERRLSPEPNSGCWLWTGAANDMSYGQIGVGGKVVYVHRAAWELLRGPIPPKMVIDHKCRVPLCCNPDHLEVVTHRENTMRGTNQVAARARQTACKRGHPFDATNTGRLADGRRYCRTCTNEVRRLLKEAGVDVQ